MATKRYDLYIERNRQTVENPLVLMKFPAMQSQLDKPADTIDMSLKPKSLKMKMNVGLDTGSQNFHADRAESLATKSIPKTFPHNFVDRNFFSSSKFSVDDDQLFVAKFTGDKMICQPVSHFLFMRSDLTHFDVKEESDVKEEIRPVSVKFAGPERSNPTPKNPNVKEEPEDNTPDEEIQISYKAPDSQESNMARSVLFDDHLPEMKVDPDSGEDRKPNIYYPEVKPKVEKFEISDLFSSVPEPAIDQGGMSEAERQSRVKKLVKECLMKAKIVSFSELYDYIKSRHQVIEPSQICRKDMLDALSDLAILVQGNWAIKGDILYRDSSQRDITEDSGIPLDLYINARDYLLWLFTQDRQVNRAQYCKRVRLPDYDVKTLFNQLAMFRPETKNWELKLPTDTKFISTFPEVVQRQATFWKVRKANKLVIFD